MEHNYTLRDLLKQWLGDLEGEIQKRSAAHHTLHLYEFSKFATAYLTELRAMATCLEPIYNTLPRKDADVEDGEENDLRHKHSDDIKRDYHERRRREKNIPTLAYFFNNEYIFFRDLTDEIETICSDVSG